MIETVDSAFIFTATSESFDPLVLENSERGPVLVNFWSRKAGPCLRLYPVLDKIIHFYSGKLMLVNIDVEREVIVPKQYGVNSVPTVKLFCDRQVAETFHGYHSEQALKSVLEIYVSRESDQVIARAVRLYSEGNKHDAYQMLIDAIVGDPVNPRLPLAICKMLKHEKRYKEAMKIIDSLGKKLRHHHEIVQLYALLFFLTDIDYTKDLQSVRMQLAASPNDIEIKRQLLAQYVAQQHYEEALTELVGIIQLDHSYDNKYAQTAMLRVFELLGQGHALINKYRPYLKRYSH